MRHSLTMILAVFALLTVSTCGKKGDLEPPEGYDKPETTQE